MRRIVDEAEHALARAAATVVRVTARVALLVDRRRRGRHDRRVAGAPAQPADELEIVAFERGEYTSYSACGIPYFVGGLVADVDDLIARSPEEHRAQRHRPAHAAPRWSRSISTARTVTARDVDTGRETTEPFDELVIATGATPVRPAAARASTRRGVHGVQTLGDGIRLRDELVAGDGDTVARRRGRRRLHRARAGRSAAPARPAGHDRRIRRAADARRSIPTWARSSPTRSAGSASTLITDTTVDAFETDADGACARS